MLSAIITLSPDDDTFGALRRFLADCDTFGLDDTLELIDGGHVHLRGAAILDHGNDLAAVKAFVTAHDDVADSTELADALLVAVDLPVRSVSPILCGEHRSEVTNVHATVHPQCAAEHD